jgi:hypothetical protein
MQIRMVYVACLLLGIAQTSYSQPDAATVTAVQKVSPVRFAIGSFYGFYFNSVKFNPDYCKSLGVDVAAYVKAFKAVNQDAYWAATNALRIDSKGSKDEDSIYQQMAPTLSDMARKGWDDTAAKNHITPRKLCQNVSENADFFASTEIFSKRHPEQMKTLQDAK